MAVTSINYLPPAANSFYWSEANNNGLNILGQSDLAHQIQPFQNSYSANGRGEQSTYYISKWL